MSKAHRSYSYDDDSWREIMRYGQRKMHELGISQSVKLTSEEWHALINVIVATDHMIGQRSAIDLDEVAEAFGNHDR